ncbi:MAG: metal-dependent hydrolase [Polyangiales bacterium]
MSDHATAVTPIDIPVRHMGFAFPEDLPRHWCGGDPFETHLLNALSLTFPIGEKQFIDSVRAFADQITDAQLKDDVRAFVGQEMQHSREHQAFNDWIASLGLPAAYVENDIKQRIARTNKIFKPIHQLAVTCALEHFTAIMAEAFLTNPELLAEFDERVRTMWVWHAIEETEHKSVAFDVFEHVGGEYSTRVWTMMLITFLFIRNQTHFHRTLMKADGELFNVKSWARGLYKYWGPKGVFTKLAPAYLAYYRRDFHPWQHDNRELVARYKREVEAKAKRVVPQATKAEARRAA